jgi:hypothetical protein
MDVLLLLTRVWVSESAFREGTARKVFPSRRWGQKVDFTKGFLGAARLLSPAIRVDWRRDWFRVD